MYHDSFCFRGQQSPENAEGTSFKTKKSCFVRSDVTPPRLARAECRCGATYTHVESRPGNGGSGTSGMLHHLLKKHPLIHAEIMGASPVAKARRSEGDKTVVEWSIKSDRCVCVCVTSRKREKLCAGEHAGVDLLPQTRVTRLFPLGGWIRVPPNTCLTATSTSNLCYHLSQVLLCCAATCPLTPLSHALFVPGLGIEPLYRLS